MGRAYVDAHRLLLYQAGKPTRDITEAVGDLQARDVRNALSVELSFSTLTNPRDRYAPVLGLRPGDKLRLVNHDKEIFRGVIITKSLGGDVTANDMGWYLNKSEIVLQGSGIAAGTLIARMCAKAGIPFGGCCPLVTRINQVWVGSTPSAILGDILETCAAETGKEYLYRVEDGKLWVSEQPTAPITAYHKPADNLAAFDITWALGQIEGSDSIDGLYNSVLLTDGSGDNARIIARASNAASIAAFGFLQKVENLSSGDNVAQARQRVRNLLRSLDRFQVERTVDEVWGTDEVKSGVVLRFSSAAYGLTGLHRVDEVTHHYGKTHTMALSLAPVAQPRAAGDGDTVRA